MKRKMTSLLLALMMLFTVTSAALAVDSTYETSEVSNGCATPEQLLAFQEKMSQYPSDVILSDDEINEILHELGMDNVEWKRANNTDEQKPLRSSVLMADFINKRIEGNFAKVDLYFYNHTSPPMVFTFSGTVRGYAYSGGGA